MSCTIIRPKNHNEWLGCRRDGIGSSDVGTILGVNPFDTPYQLWRRKKGLDAPKSETFAMKAGHYLEDAVSLFYQDETGNEIIKSSKGDWLAVDDTRNYLRVSPDRTFWLPNMPHNDRNKGILECKTTQREINADDVPQHWFCQLQYQLGVMGYEKGALAWLTAGRNFGYRDFAFDPDFYGWLIEEVDKFWTDNIIGNKEPEPTSVGDVLVKFPRSIMGKSLVGNEELFSTCNRLREVKEQLKGLDTEKRELEDKIKIAMGDCEVLVSEQGEKLATWKTSKDSLKFDEKRFAGEQPDLYKSYQVTKAGIRTFLLK